MDPLPVLQSFCCQNATFNDYNISPTLLSVYNFTCLTASLFGVFGAMYQLLPKKLKRRLPSHEVAPFMRQNYIICCLAIADLCVSIGILLRSAVRQADIRAMEGSESSDDMNFARVFCATIVAWCQYLYICTYFWTFCYALEVDRILRSQPSLKMLYHMISWGLSAIICCIGLFPIFYPSRLRCERSSHPLLIHWLSGYVPMVFVMIANPILYVRASNALSQQLRRHSWYTDAQRHILSRLQRRFILIILAFYFCWLPNLLIGFVLLPVYWHKLPYGLVLLLQELSAITNPLQAFLNGFVYSGYAGCVRSSYYSNEWQSSHADDRHTAPLASSNVQASSGVGSEHDPLLPRRAVQSHFL